MDAIDDSLDAAWRARREGRQESAERMLLDAVTVCRQTGTRRQLIRALGALAHVVRDGGLDDRALLLSEEAVALGRDEGDGLLLAHAVRHLGDLHRDGGRLAAAERCYVEALALYRTAASPDPLDFANALRPAALLKEQQGDAAGARRLWAEARAHYQTAGVQVAVDECVRRLAELG